MSQILRPISDILIEGWLQEPDDKEPYYTKIDEVIQNEDDDYIYSENSSPDSRIGYFCGLSSASTPQSGDRMLSIVSMFVGEDANVKLEVGLTDGVNTYSEIIPVFNTTYSTETLIVNTNFNNYSNLEFFCRQSEESDPCEEIRVTQVEFEIPDAQSSNRRVFVIT